VVKCLPSKCEALSSNPTTDKKVKIVPSICFQVSSIQYFVASQVPVAYTYNPGYSGGRNQEAEIKISRFEASPGK
jgi:hypothetical protein